MTFRKYIMDKLNFLMIGFVFWGMVVIFLRAYGSFSEEVIILTFLFGVFILTTILLDYYRKRKFYNTFLKCLDGLDKKYLILEMIKEPDFYEGAILYNALYDIDKSMAENVKNYKMKTEEFKNYIEMWVHEIKLPISSLLLMCHNHRDRIDIRYVDQLRRLDNYVDQVLYYVRSEHMEKDYHIREVSLYEVVHFVALHSKDDILENNISFSTENLDINVMTDEKWIQFMVNQLVNNSIKYKKEGDNSRIKIYAKDYKDYTELHIWDNGVGIENKDLGKVCNKCFTGDNGINRVKSTGMGLYIVKGLCDRLGHRISIESEVGKYTDVKIVFGKHEYFFH